MKSALQKFTKSLMLIFIHNFGFRWIYFVRYGVSLEYLLKFKVFETLLLLIIQAGTISKGFFIKSATPCEYNIVIHVRFKSYPLLTFSFLFLFFMSYLVVAFWQCPIVSKISGGFSVWFNHSQIRTYLKLMPAKL